MDKRIFEMHAEICKVFTNPKRIEIICLLREGERSVKELSELMKTPQANISQHLAVLRQKHVVVARKDGTNTYYRIANPKISKACDLMREVLLEQLAENEKLVKEVKL